MTTQTDTYRPDEDPTLITSQAGAYVRTYKDAYPSQITGAVEHKEPTVAAVKTSAGIWASKLTRYLDMLADLGVDDPCDVAARLQRHKQLQGEAVAIHRGALSTPETAGLVDALTAGKLNPADIASKIPATADPGDTRAAIKIIRAAAAEVLLHPAIHDMWTYGDKYLTLLQPVHDHLIAQPRGPVAADHWAQLHKTVRFLRDDLKVIPSAVGASALEYRYANPLLVHCWHLDHADRGAHIAAADFTCTPPKLYRQPLRPQPIPLPVVAEHAEDWKPGLYTATQAIANAEQINRANLKHGDDLRRL